MTKAEMINAIGEKAKQAAFLENKFLDTTDLFFTLAFTADESLKTICQKLGVYKS